MEFFIKFIIENSKVKIEKIIESNMDKITVPVTCKIPTKKL